MYLFQFNFFIMEYNCLKCVFLLYNMNQLYVYIYIPSLLKLSHSPNPPLYVITEHCELSSLCHTTASHCFTPGSAYMSALLSQIIQLSLSPKFTSLFSTSVSLFLPCKQVHLYQISRFHIYAVIYTKNITMYFYPKITCSSLAYFSTLHTELN